MRQKSPDFQTYYRQYFDSEEAFDRWWAAMKNPTRPVLRFSEKNKARLRELWQEAGLEWRTLEWWPRALMWPEGFENVGEIPGYDDHLFYAQNASSLVPVLALDPKPRESVLDLCAAPGGKALFIAELMERQGELIANDLSNDRRGRMRQVFSDYGVEDFATVSGWNGMSAGGRYPEYFDRILVDAPCSSEKHVIASPKHLAEWKPGRIRHLRKLQFRLLQSAWKALKPGGRLVYSTCASNPEENEGVVNRFLEKFEGVANAVPLSKDLPNENGYIRPQDLPGMDPMYVAVITKERS